MPDTLATELAQTKTTNWKSTLMSKSITSTSWFGHWSQLVDRITLVRSSEEAQTLMGSLATVTRPTVVAFANAHTFNEACRKEFAQAIGQAHIVLRDGIGVSSLFRLMGKHSGLNMNGTDFIPKFLEYISPERLALFGTEEQFVRSAAHALSTTLPTASYICVADGFRTADYYIGLVREQRPAVVVLGMGIPRQENVAGAIAAGIDFPCIIICGGAILDFMGGRVVRAPYWIRAARSEWIYRLALEPRRLFRRYVLGVPIFCTRSLLFALYRVARNRTSKTTA